MCKGLWEAYSRHVARSGKVCGECRSGKVITRSKFHRYWTSRFTHQEIEEMAKAIWG
jgi:hypothetical protein